MMIAEVPRSRPPRRSRGDALGSSDTASEVLSTGWPVMPPSTPAASASRPWRGRQEGLSGRGRRGRGGGEGGEAGVAGNAAENAGGLGEPAVAGQPVGALWQGPAGHVGEEGW